jgi:hypothetical protein
MGVTGFRHKTITPDIRNERQAWASPVFKTGGLADRGWAVYTAYRLGEKLSRAASCGAKRQLLRRPEKVSISLMS